MAGRPNNRGPGGGQPPVPPAAQRQNEYFVPRDGIDREVITSDICRYLGNDALVRPGTYEVCPASSSPAMPSREGWDVQFCSPILVLFVF